MYESINDQIGMYERIHINDLTHLIDNEKKNNASNNIKAQQELFDKSKAILEFYLSQLTKDKVEKLIAKAIADGSYRFILITENFNEDNQDIDRESLIHTKLCYYISNENEDTLYERITKTLPYEFRIHSHYKYLTGSGHKTGFMIQIHWNSCNDPYCQMLCCWQCGDTSIDNTYIS
jgi:hypothetical protein